MSGGGLPVVADLGVGFGAVAFALEPTALGVLADTLRADARSDRDPAAHVRAAADLGGVRYALSHHPPSVVGLGRPPGWGMVVVRPTGWTTDSRLVRNALPRDIAAMKHYRQSALAAGLALGLRDADADLVRRADADAVLEPALGPRLPGYFPAAAAARAAGALLFGFDAGGACLAALVPDDVTGRCVAEALTASFAAHASAATAVFAPLAEVRDGDAP